ncbi:MAG: CBS domain-containing protein [Myxococcales bacterium]|nr:CBS domain-containing protein [Myxococcales bacterium]MDH5305863.1 CBS domain-containing protein [Myxococcales bacterium]MDH5566438.1 CBS domain-containing protein [Myxococcales bacterium]
MHKLRQVIQRLNLICARSDEPVLDVATRMSEEQVGALPIIDDGELVGIFSERDLMTRVLVAGRDARSTRISEVMTRNVITAGLDDSVETCVDKMRDAGCRHLPVIQGGRVIAMLSMRDLLRDEIEEQTEEIRHLRAYIHQVPSEV